MTNREYKQPGPERAYELDERGYAFAGYMHHASALLQQFYDAARHAAERCADTSRLYPFGPPTDVEVRLRIEYWKPRLDDWEVELRRSASGLGLSDTVAPLISALNKAIPPVQKAADDLRPRLDRWLRQRQQQAAGKARKGTRKAPPLRRPSADALLRRVAAVQDAVAALAKLWPQFDPAKAVVDRGVEAWERFHELAIDVDMDLSQLLSKGKPGSEERSKESERLRTLMNTKLFAAWDSAVKFALSDELGSKIHAACEGVFQEAQRLLDEAHTQPVLGTKEWLDRWGSLNDAVIELQQLRPLIRRAVRATRLNTERALEAARAEAEPSRAKRPRLTLDERNFTAVLDGRPLPLKVDGYYALRAIMQGRGQYVGADEIRRERYIARPDRAVQGLPPAIRALIRTKPGAGGGSAIDPSVLGTIDP